MSHEGRLSPAEAAEVLNRSQPIAVERGSSPIPVSAIFGADLAGASSAAVVPPVDQPTLLLFLSASCGGCVDLFSGAQPAGGIFERAGVRTLIVLRDADDLALGGLVGSASCVVAPSAWTAYQVGGAPFFSLLLPGHDAVAIEGVAWGAEAVARSVSRALSGDLSIDVPRLQAE